MIFASKTDVGKKRQNNEDSVLAKENLLIVADGMGGHNAGEVASSVAVSTVDEMLSATQSDFAKNLINAVETANEKIFSMAKDDRLGMGTTLEVVLYKEDTYYIAHVGDSRIYLIRDGKMEKLTKDHSYVELLRQKGELTEEEAKNYPMKNMITKAVGVAGEVKADYKEVMAKKGDILVLTSDGLTNMVSDEEIKEIVTKMRPIRQWNFW